MVGQKPNFSAFPNDDDTGMSIVTYFAGIALGALLSRVDVIDVRDVSQDDDFAHVAELSWRIGRHMLEQYSVD